MHRSPRAHPRWLSLARGRCYNQEVEIRLLGPLEVIVSNAVVPMPRRQQRALLASLALRAGEVVSTDRLVAELWGEQAPASALGSLQNTVAALRKLLGHDAVLTQAPGYRLAVPREAVDANRFEQLVTAARAVEPATRARQLREALALWRGTALAGLEDHDFARFESSRLDELRLLALEEWADAELELGRHAALVGELEQVVALHPLRERPRGQLMLALYRCGRQAEALEVYRAARLTLAEELGLDPAPELQELERKILRQDPGLAAPAAVDEAAPAEEAAERLLVTVLAAAPPGAEDPEEHRRRLDETLAAVRDVLDRHGGVLERFGPEGLVALFGAEGARDDDALRAVRAAQELGLAAGVATGEVVQGAGAVVNRAVALARRPGLSLDERTQSLVAATRHLDAPLVGRTEELARLRAALAAAREGSRCVVLTVAGEPGVGKTRLARELAQDEEQRATVLLARCVSHGDGAALLPLVDMLRRFEWAPTLPDEPDGELVLTRLRALVGGGQAPLGESYWAVRRLFETLAHTQPVLLLLDDVHWAGAALLDLIDYLAERVAAPLVVLCLARPELERRPGEALDLRPLRDDETRAIVAGTADLDDETQGRIVELAEGNALYAEQLATFAAEGGEGLPPTLEAVLSGRLGRLAGRERTVLQRAAVVGRDFSLGAATALAGEDVSRHLLALSRAGFVHPAATADPGDDGYTFHHVLLRDAAYGSVTKADRATLHERVAAWLDRDGPGDDALVGYHLERAAGYRRELGEDLEELAAVAGERLANAGVRVLQMGDLASAADLIGRATALLPHAERRAELLWESAIVLRLRGRPADADAALAEAEQAAETLGLPWLTARVVAERTLLDLLSGQLGLDDAVVEFEAALETLREAGDDRGLGRAELCACAVHWFAANNAAAAAGARRAAAHYLRAGISPAACVGAEAEALFYGATGVKEGVARCLELQHSAPDRMTEANVTAVLGALQALGGDAIEARSLLDQARTLYEDLGNQRGLIAVWTPLRVEAAIVAGDLETAVALARENVEAFIATGERGYATARALRLADILLLRGEDEAADRATFVAERDALPSDVLVQFKRRSVRARLLARGGDVGAAEPLARDAVRIAAQTDCLCDRARAHLALAEVLELAGAESAASAEEAIADELLRLKGVKGALVGAPFT